MSEREYSPGLQECYWCEGTGVEHYDPNDGTVVNICEKCGGSGALREG